METFPRLWPFVRGTHRSPVNSPHKCHAVTLSFDVFFAAEQTAEQTFETPVIWDAIALIMTPL